MFGVELIEFVSDGFLTDSGAFEEFFGVEGNGAGFQEATGVEDGVELAEVLDIFEVGEEDPVVAAAGA